MSEKVDLSTIEYVPASATPEKTEKPQDQEKDVHEMMKEARKIKKVMDKENKKMKQKDSEEQSMDKQRLIAILQIYIIDFKDRLSQFRKTNFQKMSYEELTDLRKQFDGIISSKSSLKQSQAMVLGGIQVLETCVTKFTPIKCNGLFKSIADDEDALDDIKHLSLKRMGLVPIEPEMRLLWTVVQNAMALHTINSVGKPVSNDKLIEVNAKYNDL